MKKRIPIIKFFLFLLTGWLLILNPASKPLAAIPHCSDPNKMIDTEIGKICTEPEHLIQDILEILLYVAGGISLILMLIGAGMYALSSGNPEKTEEAKKMITAAVSGSLLIFFSIFLLRFIGIDVLGIPGLAPLGTGVQTP